MREVKSFCRLCAAGCGTVLSIDDNDQIVDIRGDKNHELSRGYACFKGFKAHHAHHGSERLLHPLKRQPDGTYVPISSEQALDEIAEKMRIIRDRDGPSAIALYSGGGAFLSFSAFGMLNSFLSAIGSDQWFTTATIDQPNKGISIDRMGGWAPGIQELDRSEVLLLLGTNPLVSHQALPVLMVDPARRLKAAKARGMKLICIDPRRTETARRADLHLQPIPGQDPAILAGLIHVILAQGWEDAAFCAQYVGPDRLAGLRDAVAMCIPDVMERRAGLKPGQIRSVAEMFARDHKAGSALMSTGGSFAPFANLTQHLVDLLNIICGRLNRAGDRITVDMLAPAGPKNAEVTPPTRSWESLPPSRIRGISSFFGQKLTPNLADEILQPGEGQIRCLIMSGGNPANVVPDQARMSKAIRSLELSVTIDPWFTASAQLSDYVLAPKMMYERADLPFSYPGVLLQPMTHSQFTPAIIPPPAGSDVIDDWYFFWAIAKRLGMQIIYDGKAPLDMSEPPTTEELISIRLQGARVSLEELKRYPGGREFTHPDAVVAPARPGATARFDVMPADVAQELNQFLATQADIGNYVSNGRNFRYLLSSRRSTHIFNSTLSQLPEVGEIYPYSVVYINPEDMSEQGIEPGEEIEIESDYSSIRVVAKPDKDMRRGVVSMVHGWGGPKGTQGLKGTNVNELIDSRRDYGTINAMPRMSAIPVNLNQVPPSNNESELKIVAEA